MELADFIKNGKYTRSLGGALSRREINLISKKLNKEIKDKIEPKNVKIMRNINEVENLDFKGRNTIEYNSHNIYSYDFNRLSKSQNNFNHNNTFGKKKIFGLGNTIGCNLPGFNISLFVLNVARAAIIFFTTFSQCLTNKL